MSATCDKMIIMSIIPHLQTSPCTCCSPGLQVQLDIAACATMAMQRFTLDITDCIMLSLFQVLRADLASVDHAGRRIRLGTQVPWQTLLWSRPFSAFAASDCAPDGAREMVVFLLLILAICIALAARDAAAQGAGHRV